MICRHLLGLLLLLFVTIASAQLDTHFDDAQVYWPSEYKRSAPAQTSSEGEMFAFPGLRGLRGKRDPVYNKRVPMMSLKGLRGKRGHFYGGQEEQEQ
ncbi:hypothetical protein GCK72_016882 [Caenorhabditis remanei]|uniref:Uncharacterized protein n=1 Tax=Caenorhabditis remanei TaxID=31234 RepID=A0A6A5G6A6_CAERE|nr:hypothetical protein GCK72_016882 [Caenorhabditis remanei]KAF1750333.1 hypothetical protein GCK72_016882 [Caenorhabditis remanei]